MNASQKYTRTAEMLNLDLLGELEAQIYHQMSLRELERFHQECDDLANNQKWLAKYEIRRKDRPKIALRRLLEVFNGQPPMEES